MGFFDRFKPDKKISEAPPELKKPNTESSEKKGEWDDDEDKENTVKNIKDLPPEVQEFLARVREEEIIRLKNEIAGEPSKPPTAEAAGRSNTPARNRRPSAGRPKVFNVKLPNGEGFELAPDETRLYDRSQLEAMEQPGTKLERKFRIGEVVKACPEGSEVPEDGWEITSIDSDSPYHPDQEVAYLLKSMGQMPDGHGEGFRRRTVTIDQLRKWQN